MDDATPGLARGNTLKRSSVNVAESEQITQALERAAPSPDPKFKHKYFLSLSYGFETDLQNHSQVVIVLGLVNTNPIGSAETIFLSSKAE